MASTVDGIWNATNPIIPEVRHVRAPSMVHRTGVDIDATCFMMDMRDLTGLFGEIARPAIRKVPMRDSKYYDDWVHVISEPIVIKVNLGVTIIERQQGKRSVCRELRLQHGLSLTSNTNDLVLSKSQVNIPLQAMVEALQACGHKECRVGFYGMKWAFTKAQPKIDRTVHLHMSNYGVQAVVKRNRFDIGMKLSATAVHIFRFGELQSSAPRMYRTGRMHDMFNVRGYGSLNFNVFGYPGIENIKIYQEVTHAIISGLPKSCLDDMPKTIGTVRVRLEQMTKLIHAWEQYNLEEREEYLLGTRIEITIIDVHTILEAHNICLELDLLSLHGIEKFLGGPFEVRSMSINEVLLDARKSIDALTLEVVGANERAPEIKMRAALTHTRQALGWSGKNMPKHLAEARRWTQSLEILEVQQEDPEYEYDGWEMDNIHMRPIMKDFLENAHWQDHSRGPRNPLHCCRVQRARTSRGGSGFWATLWVDRVGAARHFVTLYGSTWRRHVKEKPAAIVPFA